MKEYSNYDKVDSKYKWDLESILEGKTLEYWFNKYEELVKESIRIKDSKYDSIEAFIKGLEQGNEVAIVANKISNYLSNKISINLLDFETQKMSTMFQAIAEKLNNEFGSETNRFFKNIDKIKLWVNDKRLASHKRMLTEVINNYEHKLSDDVEEFLNETASGYPDFEEVFDELTNSELEYKSVLDSKNKKHKLNPGTFVKLVKSNDAILRKNTVSQYNKAKLRHKESLANMLVQTFKSTSVFAKARKFESSVQMLTFEDKITDEILLKLFEKVASLKDNLSRYKKKYKQYYEAKYKEKYRSEYDSYRDLIKVKSNYSVEEAKEIIREAFKHYGDEYCLQIKKALDENWIDFMMVKNKVSGAYSIGNTYGIDKKFILMNFDGQIESLETLAHELGHSMHSYFSDKNNEIHNADYPIFLAEIASIFNEIMLYDYLLKKSTDKKFKFFILSKMIDGFIGTVISQTILADYEYTLYKKVDDNVVSTSYEELARIFYDSAKKYTKKAEKFKKDKCLASVIVPHFYNGFYVYKYAIGQLISIYFYKKYKKEGDEFINLYINEFLKVGSRYSSLETIKRLGINLQDDNFYKEGYDYFENLINEWIKLGDEIFKINSKKAPKKSVL